MTSDTRVRSRRPRNTARAHKPRALSDSERAELFQGLAHTLSAGLDAMQSLHAMRGICGGALDAALTRAASAVGKGTALLRALDHNALISPHDYPLLAVAENSGALAHACEQFARRYQRSAARWRQLKGKLLLPAAVLVIAIIVLPLPALMAGTLGIADYLINAAAMLILLATLVQLAAMLIMHWRTHGTPRWVTRLARLLPVFAGMSHLHQRADTNERLALALRCGAPAAEALEIMSRGEQNPLRRSALDRARKELAAGAPLASALQQHDLLDAAQFAVVSAGEGAGRLDDSLNRVAADCHDELDARYALIAQWLPVLMYLCVAGMVLIGLL